MPSSDYLNWYHALHKPSWTPNENVIGLIWSLLYPIIIGVNIYVLILLRRHEITWKQALPFWLNVIANVAFTPLQFGLRNNLLAFIDCLLIVVTLLWAMSTMWRVRRFIVWLYIPYLLWVTIATSLQLSIVLMNR